MATVTQIRDGLATRLGNISGLRTAATVPDDPNPPQAIVMPQEIQYDTAMARGLDTFTYTILDCRARGRAERTESAGRLLLKHREHQHQDRTRRRQVSRRCSTRFACHFDAQLLRRHGRAKYLFGR